MKPTPGSRWKSMVCDTEAIMVRVPRDDGVLECGGFPMIPFKDETPAGLIVDPGKMGGSLLGKRYGDEAQGLEVLCTKYGQGTMSLDGKVLTVREAKQLPSSD